MSFNHSKLRLTGAFVALATLALAASCRGFFTSEQLQSITVSPSSVTVPLGGTTQMHAFGVNTDGSQAGDVTSKVSWTSSSGIVTLDPDHPGLLTGQTLSTDTATITASYQALTPQTATAAVCVEGGSNFVITPIGISINYGDSFPNNGGFTATVDAQVSGTSQTVDVTSGVTFSSSNTDVLSITNGVDPATATLESDPTSQTAITITATYTCNGVTITQTGQLTVNP